MRMILLLSLGLLAACGADGAPETPPPGITMTGEAQIGVVGSF